MAVTHSTQPEWLTYNTFIQVQVQKNVFFLFVWFLSIANEHNTIKIWFFLLRYLIKNFRGSAITIDELIIYKK